MRISDWGSDVCSSDLIRKGKCRRRVNLVPLPLPLPLPLHLPFASPNPQSRIPNPGSPPMDTVFIEALEVEALIGIYDWERRIRQPLLFDIEMQFDRSEEHTSELQSLMRISYAVFC